MSIFVILVSTEIGNEDPEFKNFIDVFLNLNWKEGKFLCCHSPNAFGGIFLRKKKDSGQARMTRKGIKAFSDAEC